MSRPILARLPAVGNCSSPVVAALAEVALRSGYLVPHGMKVRRFLGNVIPAKVFNALTRNIFATFRAGFRAINREVLAELSLAQSGM